MQSHACAALTMAWKSHNFLRKWVAHYGDAFGRENLFIMSHGHDPIHAEIGAGCNIVTVPRVFSTSFDFARWRAISGMARMLTEFYAVVIAGDCDEYVALNPQAASGQSLDQYLLAKAPGRILSPLGFNIVNDPDAPSPVDWSKPLLEQVPRAATDSHYCKPCILGRAAELGDGGHGLVDEDFDLDPALFLVHAKYAEIETATQMGDAVGAAVRDLGEDVGDKMSIGWHWRGGAETALESLRVLRALPMTDHRNPLAQLEAVLMHRGKVTRKDIVRWRLLRSFNFGFEVPVHLRHLV